MGALDEGHFTLQLVDGLSVEVGFEPETLPIEEAVKVLLRGLGEDIDREGLRKTPARVAKALSEGTRGYRQKARDIVRGALFPEAGLDDGVGHAGGVGGLVVVRDLDLFSYCESCLLPFQVKCHVGYIPSGQQVVGLSKLSRVADVFAKRLQEPQRLANEVCSALNHLIKPAGVAVVLQCLHIHFPNLELGFLDSNHKEWVKGSVCSGKGLFENAKAAIWSDFLSLLKLGGINVEKTFTGDTTRSCWCPSKSSSALTPCKIEPAQQMVAAVTSILKSLGEDPSREELLGSPYRYVRWLKNFEKIKLEVKLNGLVSGRVDLFDRNSSNDEMQSELNLAFWSLCEHHLLPFHGVVHIGYFCTKGTNPIPRSTLESIVHFYGFKLQVQERLTRQVSETVSALLGCDVIVVVEASHSCMVSRGIEKLGSKTATMALLGRFSTNDAAKNVFFQSIQNTSTSSGQVCRSGIKNPADLPELCSRWKRYYH